MCTIFMTVKYDGSHYYGWQRQNHHKNIQSTIEKALSDILRKKIIIDGSGRTDAGVHATGQCFSFKANLPMPVEQLKYALNRTLPDDIYVLQARVESDDFHARYSAVGKTYLYKVYPELERDPFLSPYSFHFPNEINMDHIKIAMTHFLGTHNFRTFMASGSKTENCIRTIYQFDVKQNGQFLEFVITGDGFLYNMVRIIMGTLLHVGMGKINANDIPDIINSGDRNRAKFTAPANGLYLNCVYYSKVELENRMG